MLDFSQQPQAIAVSAWVLGHFDKMAAAHSALITAPIGSPVIGAVALQCPIGQMFTTVSMGELAWKGVVLKVWLQRDFSFAVQLQARFFEVVITPADVGRAGIQAQLELVNHWRFGDHAAVLPVRG